MNKVLLIILIAGLSATPTAKGQQRSSGNPSGKTPAAPTYKSGYTSSLMPSAGFTQKQETIPTTSDWKAMDIQEKREAVRNMSPKDRGIFLQKMKEDIVIDNLGIAQNQEEQFKALYTEYQNNQKQIKEKFSVGKNVQNLSNEEARKRLDQSFEVGQELLNNRRAYADKFLKFLTPQQVLMLFQTEGKMRDKVLEKKNDK